MHTITYLVPHRGHITGTEVPAWTPGQIATKAGMLTIRHAYRSAILIVNNNAMALVNNNNTKERTTTRTNQQTNNNIYEQ